MAALVATSVQAQTVQFNWQYQSSDFRVGFSFGQQVNLPPARTNPVTRTQCVAVRIEGRTIGGTDVITKVFDSCGRVIDCSQQDGLCRQLLSQPARTPVVAQPQWQAPQPRWAPAPQPQRDCWSVVSTSQPKRHYYDVGSCN